MIIRTFRSFSVVLRVSLRAPFATWTRATTTTSRQRRPTSVPGGTFSVVSSIITNFRFTAAITWSMSSMRLRWTPIATTSVQRSLSFRAISVTTEWITRTMTVRCDGTTVAAWSASWAAACRGKRTWFRTWSWTAFAQRMTPTTAAISWRPAPSLGNPVVNQQ